MKILILNSGRLQISRHISFVGSYRLHRTKRSNKTIVLSDMLSGSIKYQDLWSEIHILIAIFLIRNSYLLIKIGSKRIKILILNSGRLQISRHISFVDSNRLYKWRISLVTIKSQETTIRIKMQSKLIIPTRNYKNVKNQQSYCSVGYAIRQHQTSGSVIRDSYLNSYFFD